MDVLSFLNSDYVLPMVAVLVIAVYVIMRIRNRNRFKRD